MAASSTPLRRWSPVLAFTGVTFAVLIWLSSWTGTGQPSAAIDAIWVLLTSGPYAAFWLAGAIGVGRPLRAWLVPHAHEATAMQMGLGVVAMLFTDATLGSLGILQLGGSLVAWAIPGLGVALLIIQSVRHQHTRNANTREARFECPRDDNPPELWNRTYGVPRWNVLMCAAVPLAVLLLAACSAPGVLWATEFGGYDALSYHLQLPNEWLALGRMQPLEHNVYSFLPGYVEAAYYHLAILQGSAIDAAYSCQLLHAMFTILTAWLIIRVAFRFGIQSNGSIACAVLFFGTPWGIVVGSLAYNELVTMFFFCTCLLVIRDVHLTATRTAVLVGVFSGAAISAKLTSIGFVALPLFCIALWQLPLRVWLYFIVMFACSTGLVLLPYLIRNGLHSGNPVFPFLTSILGHAHWSEEQIRIWHIAHIRALSLGESVTALWNQVLRFGLGENPLTNEPWKAQWSILPWLGMLGLCAALISKSHRVAALKLFLVLVLQVAFWLVFTHAKSRFMLPAAIPLVLGLGLGLSVLRSRATWMRSFPAIIVFTLALLTWCIQPLLLFRTEGNGSPAIAVGRNHTFTGDELTDSQRRELGSSTFPAVALNWLLPSQSRSLAIGFATPLYIARPITYCTTWDRGPLSALLVQHPNDPDRWAAELHNADFTHLIVDATMLYVWERSNWNDPALTVQSVQILTSSGAKPLFTYPGGVTIYQLSNK